MAEKKKDENDQLGTPGAADQPKRASDRPRPNVSSRGGRTKERTDIAWDGEPFAKGDGKY